MINNISYNEKKQYLKKSGLAITSFMTMLERMEKNGVRNEYIYKRTDTKYEPGCWV